ncbi:2-succinyl-5-enolpyruvyl-6-hydroxy-3-cyclohexene-1-carboxylic-acid synthase [Ornithobacterium rhinotracheale]|uniref:2-succinyl-5-enolpyruvyl-6-hydroxy-3- cyclohexene-1-carboxylic-acid synthase n=1 Tax=Ornithobacterium rhinotracheale TaxID=28251 RepID=UPI004036B503
MPTKIRSKKINVQLVVEAFYAMGIRDIVISPGSRNGALTMDFVNHGGFATHSVVDERSAGFVALGMAQKTEKPVVVCCTSGSAAANYYPAVTEAFYQNIPLIVLTADRPANFTDIFDGQTIRQENLFEKHTFFNTQLSEQDDDEQIYENFIKIKKAVFSAMEQSGPVHINMPFSEPLYETTEEKLINFEQITPPIFAPETLDWEALKNELSQYQKIMILIGLQRPSKWLNHALKNLAQLPQVIIFTENTSNLHDEKFISRIDNVLFEKEKIKNESLAPDLLITLGQNIISKKIKSFLRINQPKAHWHVNPYWFPDTYFCLSKEIKQKEEIFAEALSRNIEPKDSEYQSTWLKIREENEAKQNEFLQNLDFCDLWVFQKLINSYPADCVVQYSNSSVIRYSQLFEHRDDIKIFCNRGTSGIDGSTSTAVGFAMKTEELVCLVTGDISFFYDSNALWNRALPKNLRIVLVNNGGGDIFSIIPGPENTGARKAYFKTEHNLSAKPLAELFGLEYTLAKDKAEFKNALNQFFSPSERAKILEVDTANAQNAEMMRRYIKLAKL